MNEAKELADKIRNGVKDAAWCRVTNQTATDIAAHLDRLAAIDSATTGEVGEILGRYRKSLEGRAHHDLGQVHRDAGTLLAIVQRQACDAQAALNLARGYEQERDSARAEVERLKERAARDDAGVTIHACPPTDSGIMPCCGRTPFEVMADRMTTKPEFVNCDRLRLQTERAALAQENARLINEVGELDAAAREQRLRAEVLARGLAAYRSGGYTQGQLWENEEGKAVT